MIQLPTVENFGSLTCALPKNGGKSTKVISTESTNKNDSLGRFKLSTQSFCVPLEKVETTDFAPSHLQIQRRPGQIASDLNKKTGRQILIVDGDVSLAGFLGAELEALGFVVEHVCDGEEALSRQDEKRRYDLLILDLNLPKLDGITLIRRIRMTQPRLPLLVLTARSRVEDKVLALHTGADDCITKPFSLAELLARVHALMRRNSGLIPNCSKVGDLTLFREERRVERNGRRIELTAREFAILELMMRNVGHPVSRTTLLEEVWNISSEPATNIVDVYMKYVRDKVDSPEMPRLIHTVRGVGYELCVAN